MLVSLARKNLEYTSSVLLPSRFLPFSFSSTTSWSHAPEYEQFAPACASLDFPLVGTHQSTLIFYLGPKPYIFSLPTTSPHFFLQS